MCFVANCRPSTFPGLWRYQVACNRVYSCSFVRAYYQGSPSKGFRFAIPPIICVPPIHEPAHTLIFNMPTHTLGSLITSTAEAVASAERTQWLTGERITFMASAHTAAGQLCTDGPSEQHERNSRRHLRWLLPNRTGRHCLSIKNRRMQKSHGPAVISIAHLRTRFRVSLAHARPQEPLAYARPVLYTALDM